jgi:hypothetical protein
VASFILPWRCSLGESIIVTDGRRVGLARRLETPIASQRAAQRTHAIRNQPAARHQIDINRLERNATVAFTFSDRL